MNNIKDQKKVLIATQPIGLNYGGILQTFALQYYLKLLGFQPKTLNWVYYISNFRAYLAFIKLYLRSIVKGGSNFCLYSEDSYKLVTKNTESFIQNYIELTNKGVKTKNNLAAYKELLDYDIYIAGSDQCWACTNPSQYVKSCMFDFLENIPNKKRIAYAASFGKDKFCEDDDFIKECGSLLRKFDFISVREDSGVDVCKDIFGVNATQVLDPTMLLNANIYERIINNYQCAKINSENDVFGYLLDINPDKQKIVDWIANFLKVGSCLIAPSGIFPIRAQKIRNEHILPPVEDWLKCIKNSKFVVTDSFHGTVFSILFKRPFIAIGNSSRGMTRFTSLLKLFGLEDRLVLKLEDVTAELINKPIDYERVYAILEDERKKSKKFLMNALNIQK